MATLPDLPSRERVIAALRERLPGNNLYELARLHGIAVRRQGRLNKGWVGQTIERVAGLPLSSSRGPDGGDYELKSTTFRRLAGAWVPKETIKVTQLNPAGILEEEFSSSALWCKLSRLVIVGVHHPREDRCEAVYVGSADLESSPLRADIEAFWQDVRHLIWSGEIGMLENLGNSQGWIQLRPTGTGRELSVCPVTGERFRARAFYATKHLVGAWIASDPEGWQLAPPDRKVGVSNAPPSP